MKKKEEMAIQKRSTKTSMNWILTKDPSWSKCGLWTNCGWLHKLWLVGSSETSEIPEEIEKVPKADGDSRLLLGSILWLYTSNLFKINIHHKFNGSSPWVPYSMVPPQLYTIVTVMFTNWTRTNKRGPGAPSCRDVHQMGWFFSFSPYFPYDILWCSWIIPWWFD